MKPSRAKILIVGSNGFLGSTLLLGLDDSKYCVHAIGRSSLDLRRPIPARLRDQFNSETYEYVVICAAMSDVEKCFREQELSEQVNVKGTLELLNLIQEHGSIPVFFSSDYVFSESPVPHSEEEARSPKTCYGRQKLKVELYLESRFQKFVTFRTSKLMSKTNHPKNIFMPVVDALSSNRTVGCFEDQWLNPVFVEDIAKIFNSDGFRSLNGVYHLGTKRVFTRFELAQFLAESLNLDPSLIKATRMAEMRFSEPRSHHNTLRCRKFEESLQFRFTEVADALLDLRALINTKNLAQLNPH